MTDMHLYRRAARALMLRCGVRYLRGEFPASAACAPHRHPPDTAWHARNSPVSTMMSVLRPASRCSSGPRSAMSRGNTATLQSKSERASPHAGSEQHHAIESAAIHPIQSVTKAGKHRIVHQFAGRHDPYPWCKPAQSRPRRILPWTVIAAPDCTVKALKHTDLSRRAQANSVPR
jgi:hypothetical protein